MKADKLVRVKKLAPIATEKVEELAKKASNLLGYTRLAAQVVRPTTLSQVLFALEIQPFDAESVEAYKADKVKELRVLRKMNKNIPSWRKGRVTISWKLMPIRGYTKAVPEFVLRKAVQLKEACPTVELFVDELQTKTTYATAPRRDYDPFLVAKLGEEVFWIEVWDEKKFENKLY